MKQRMWRYAWLIIVLLTACGGAEPTLVPATPVFTPTAIASTPPTAPSPTVLALAVPTPLQVQIAFAGYAAYRVQPGDTLTSISQRGGSLPVIINAYNHFDGEPVADQPLLVPQLEGATSSLPNQPTRVTSGNVAQPRAALLLELGPAAGSMQSVLKTLHAADAQATFFVSSAWIDDHPAEVRQMLEQGHQLANFVPDATIDSLSDHLTDTETALHRAVDLSATLRPAVRLPNSDDGAVQMALVAAGYLPIGDTFDSRTDATFAPEQLAGALIVVDEATLPVVLSQLAESRISARTLSEVLGP